MSDFIQLTFIYWSVVASVGLVSPGVVTDGVTLFFLKKKLTAFLVITIPTFRRPFSCVLSKFGQKFISFGYHPLDGVTRAVRPLAPSGATADLVW